MKTLKQCNMLHYSMEQERPQQMIDFDEDLVGDVSVRPNAALLAG